MWAALRARMREVVWPIIGIAAVSYFAYHAVEGDRGLLSWWRLRHEVETATEVKAELAAERQRLEQRVRLLHPNSLDPDMLDERVRLMLNYAHPGEIVIPTGRIPAPEPAEGTR